MTLDCPNCVTPWKCNGPHLEKKHSGVYSSIDGYFMFNAIKQEYVFIPNEKEYDDKQLLDISDTLKLINNQQYKSQQKIIEALQKLSDLDQELGLQ